MLRTKLIKSPNISRGFRINGKHYIRIYIREGVHVNPRTGEIDSTVEIAKKLIFGAENMPARSFLVDSLRENEAEIVDIVRGSMAWRFQGMTAYMQYSSAVGNILAVIKAWLKSGSYYKETAPNAPFTIAQKGHDIPLLDSGALIDAVDGEYV